jgi:hypothetical protein
MLKRLVRTFISSASVTAGEFSDASVDMVFVDGESQYESVLQDIQIWSPKAARMIAIHRCSQPSVKRALEEAFGREPDLVVGDIAVFRK